MTNCYVSSVAYLAVTQWAATTSYSLGEYRRQLATPAAGSERVFKVTTAGTSGGSEPSWNLGNNATTNDGSVVWTQVAGQEANQSAGNWTAPLYSLAQINLIVNTGGDTVFVSSDHNETRGALIQIPGPTTGAGVIRILTVSRVGASLPPTSTDETTGAVVSTTGAFGIQILDGFFIRGVSFSAGSGSSQADITFVGPLPIYMESCNFILNNTNTSSRIFITDTIFPPNVSWDRECTVTFGSTSQRINAIFGSFTWKNTSAVSAITAGSSIPAILVDKGSTNGANGKTYLENLDLSSLNTAIFNNFENSSGMIARNCKLHSSVIPIFGPPSTSGAGFSHSDESPCGIINSDNSSSNTNYKLYLYYKQNYVESDTTIARLNGASDGNTPLSLKMTSNAGTKMVQPARFNSINKWLTSVGGSKTATIEMIYFDTSQPTNFDIWADFSVLDSSGSPLGTLYSTRVATPLTAGTNLSSSSEDWTAGTVAARQNSHAYSLGNLIKLASNPGRVFRCTTAGTSAGSEPGGYSSAVDGGTVTDGGATFRAAWRVKISQAFTPQKEGLITCTVKSSLLQSFGRLYLDPKLKVV